MRDCASQGEQRTALLALVLAEWEEMLAGAARPLLLLDDVMSELDISRRRRLVDVHPPRRADRHHHHRSPLLLPGGARARTSGGLGPFADAAYPSGEGGRGRSGRASTAWAIFCRRKHQAAVRKHRRRPCQRLAGRIWDGSAGGAGPASGDRLGGGSRGRSRRERSACPVARWPAGGDHLLERLGADAPAHEPDGGGKA